jgi:hypothetical protein
MRLLRETETHSSSSYASSSTSASVLYRNPSTVLSFLTAYLQHPRGWVGYTLASSDANKKSRSEGQSWPSPTLTQFSTQDLQSLCDYLLLERWMETFQHQQKSLLSSSFSMKLGSNNGISNRLHSARLSLLLSIINQDSNYLDTILQIFSSHSYGPQLLQFIQSQRSEKKNNGPLAQQLMSTSLEEILFVEQELQTQLYLSYPNAVFSHLNHNKPVLFYGLPSFQPSQLDSILHRMFKVLLDPQVSNAAYSVCCKSSFVGDALRAHHCCSASRTFASFGQEVLGQTVSSALPPCHWHPQHAQTSRIPGKLILSLDIIISITLIILTLLSCLHFLYLQSVWLPEILESYYEMLSSPSLVNFGVQFSILIGKFIDFLCHYAVEHREQVVNHVPLLL